MPAKVIQKLVSTKTGITTASLLAAIPIVLGADAALDAKYQPAGEYVTVSQLEQISTDIWYQSFYLMLDDYDEAMAEGNVELAEEYLRRMERLKAQICEVDPQWPRCKDSG